jgi:cell division control protein 6
MNTKDTAKREGTNEIFKDLSVFSDDYFPYGLIGRCKESKQITEFVSYKFTVLLGKNISGEKANLIRDEKIKNRIRIFGPNGCGKTTVLRHNLEREKKFFRVITIDPKKYQTEKEILIEMFQQLGGDTGSLDEERGESWYVVNIVSAIEKMRGGAIFVFDEISFGDFGKYETLMDDFYFHLGERTDQLLSIFVYDRYVVRYVDPDNPVKPDNYLEVTFMPYQQEHLEMILSGRANEAFLPGVVDYETILILTEYGLKQNGNARKALELMARAGYKAREENAGKVTMDHVMKALAEIDS